MTTSDVVSIRDVLVGEFSRLVEVGVEKKKIFFFELYLVCTCRQRYHSTLGYIHSVSIY